MLRFLVSLQMVFMLPAFVVSGAYAQSTEADRATYIPKRKYPVLDELKEVNKKAEKAEQDGTETIQKRQKKEKEAKKNKAKELSFSLEKYKLPQMADFNSLSHFPPVAQYLTGTCWSFAATSFLESEVTRKTKKKIKLSEMHTVYYEYVEKARRYVRERGKSHFDEGSESNAVTRVVKQYGVVPATAYLGIIGQDKRHNHGRMVKLLKKVLAFAKANNIWDEKLVLKLCRAVLDKFMGPPPESFVYGKRRYTPTQFSEKLLRLNPDDYLEVMSTLKVPFYTKGEFEAPDNWWHSKAYHNLPLEEFYGTIRRAILAGHTVAIGGDVSEPGKQGEKDVMLVPSYDIRAEDIDQSAREYRIANGSTSDDHLIHLVGFVQHEGRDWFLAKDSARSARLGPNKGYYFLRADFIKLKMLTYTVHKDALKSVLAKFRN